MTPAAEQKPRRTTVSELAKLLAEGRKVAREPGLTFKMVKPGELQFELDVTPDLERAVLDRMIDDGLHAVVRILSEAANGGAK
jgi:hypothetical protein